jgi:uncharacterized SAM-binding protein YcdF (DUF218 family)
VTDLVWFFFSTGGVVSLMLAGVGWLSLRPASTRARRFLLAVAIFYGLASSYAVSYGTGRLLLVGLDPLERTDVPPGRTAIVVLGSGTFTARDWQENRFSIPDPQAASRVVEAVRVFKLVAADWVISSGGLVDPDDLDEPTAVTMREALVRLGVPADRVLTETESSNTHDEAVVVKRMLASLDVDHIVLVTSDTHMRRSLGTFRAEGIAAIPAIARHPHAELEGVGLVMPSEDGLGEAATVAHEIIGIGYYFVRGWYR